MPRVILSAYDQAEALAGLALRSANDILVCLPRHFLYMRSNRTKIGIGLAMRTDTTGPNLLIMWRKVDDFHRGIVRPHADRDYTGENRS